MRHETPEPPLESVEAIADRTPLLLPVPAPGEEPSGLVVLAAVAEGFRAADLSPGADDDGAPRWGGLVLREPLGSGTYGEVHRAWDPALERDVALKLRRVEAGVLRWLDEARALARVRHPNVVVVHGADLREGRAGIWMERLEGRTLEEELKARGPLPVAEVLRIGLELSSAVQAVHTAGLTHGDIKTANVMLEPRAGAEPRTVLMDFGTVREVLDGDAIDDLVSSGTPLVTAPEVLNGQPVTVRADLYSLGVLLFRLLTHRYPAEAATLAELRQAHAAGRRATLSSARRDLPRALSRAIDRAMNPLPAERFASARELHDALLAVAEPARVWRRRILIGALVVTSLALLSSALIWVVRPGADFNLRTESLPKPADPQWATPVWSAQGANANAQMGWLAGAVGDLDGDGRGEIAVSEVGFTGEQFQSGRVVVFFGSASGPERTPRWEARGGQTRDAFGAQLHAAGDVNGDGHPDLLVQERYARAEDGRIGAVHLYLGDGKSLGREPAWTYRSSGRRMSGLGDGLSGGFDVNGDGYSDVLIGETLWSGHHANEGIARLFLGGPRGLAAVPQWEQSGGAEDAQFGWRCAPAGDVDGDGYDDVIISAPHWNGKHRDGGQVRLYRGGPGGLSDRPAWTFEGSSDAAGLGMSMGEGGDVNGDGYSDVLLAEPTFSSGGLVQRGRILLFEGGPKGLGSRPAWQWRGPSTSAVAGAHATELRDVDGDGLADILSSAVGYSPSESARDRGLVVVFRGRREGPASSPDWYVSGRVSGTAFGGSVNWAGDTDGDGAAELLVGEPYGGAGGSSSGVLTLYRVRPAGSGTTRRGAR